MSYSFGEKLPNSVQAKMRERYRPGNSLIQLFIELFDDLLSLCPRLEICAQRRYTGLYKASKMIAYIDFQRRQIKIGFFLQDIERLGLHALPVGKFAQWSGRGQLVGYSLRQKDERVLEALAKCYGAD